MSLQPGTLVLTRRGEIPIESITKGDTVLTHCGRWCAVTSVDPRHHDGSTVAFQWQGGDRNLVVTPDHPISTPRGWLFADQVILLDEKLGLNSVLGLRPHPNAEPDQTIWELVHEVLRPVTSRKAYKGEVYNLRVEEDESFICNRVLVHT